MNTPDDNNGSLVDFPVPDTLSPVERFQRIMRNRDRSKHPPVERITEEEMKGMWQKKLNATKEGKPHGGLSAE